MRNLACQWQKVVKSGTQLDYLSIDQDSNYVYGCFNNVILKIDYDKQQVGINLGILMQVHDWTLDLTKLFSVW